MTQSQTILCPRCHQPGRRQARYCLHCGFDMVLNNPGPRYYITRVIKAGGQGAVFETVGDDDKIYAVKEMLDGFTDPKERSEAVARFIAEAELLERLSHPRIPKVYTHFLDEGRNYLAMDFIRGEDLEDIVEKEGAIEEKRVLDWIEQICDVLNYLHDNGMVYRDMKPSNVMIDQQNGGIKLIDFGIAKVFQKGQRGTQIGTPGYAPPEQYQGLASVESDIFALAATMHHLLTGRDPRDFPPFSFPTVRSLKPNVSQRTSDAIERALEMRPEDRFHSLRAFCKALGVSTTPLPSAQPQTQRPAAAQQPSTVVLPQQRPPAQQQRPPAQQQRPPAQQQRPPVQQQRPQASARPQPAQPQVSSAQQPVAQKPARRNCLGTIIGLVLFLALLVLAGYVFVSPSLGDLPLNIQATATPQTLVRQPFQKQFEIVVPPGTDEQGLSSAFQNAYLQLAREQYGEGVQLQQGSLTYTSGGAPQLMAEEANGQRYRATMSGFILVPQ